SSSSPISSGCSAGGRRGGRVPRAGLRLVACGLLALALAVSAPFFPPVAALAETAGEVAPRIPAKAMAHIMARHGPDSDAPGAGKYAKGTTEDTIRALIAEALRDARPTPDTNFRPALLYDYRFPRIIGTTIDGAPTDR